MAEKQINPRLVWMVTVLLALLFAGLGVMLLAKPEHFASLAPNPDAVSLLVFRGLGVVFVAGAGLLLVPRLAWLGALVLVAILLGLIGLLVYQNELAQTAVPALFVVSLGSLAYIRRPGKSPAAVPPGGGPSAV